MTGPGAQKKGRWELTGPSFRALLDFLDPDPGRAPERYEHFRQKLVRLFEWKGCIPGDDYADETIDRVAKRLEQGLESQPENPYLYFHGIAVNVIRERWRKASREPQPIDTLPESRRPVADPFEMEQRQNLEAENERRLACLHGCLDRLPGATRELLVSYHLEETGSQIGKRKRLAETLNIPATALRLRIFRIRRQLEKCMRQCLARRAE
jgi:RNA polymerase sigma factor (sigma-70 family)